MNVIGAAYLTHVFGVALGQCELMTLLGEQAHGEGVLVDVTAGESLVGKIEEWEQVTLLDQCRQLSPLLWFWINTGWIVGTGVQQDDRTLWDFLQNSTPSF